MADFSYTLDGTVPDAVPTDIDRIRLLLNDVDEPTMVFTDSELRTFLLLEGGAVKLAAAQAIDTNADNEALASKVLHTQDLTTDGAKLAAVLHSRAEQLRNQHFNDLEDGGYFEIVDTGHGCGPELAEHHHGWF